MNVKPLRNLLFVQRVKRPEKTAGGIYIPQTFDHRARPELRIGATPDYWEAEVLAVGPDARGDVVPGEHVLVKTWAGDEHQGLYAGQAIDDDHVFVRCPQDIIGLVQEAPKP